MALTCLLLQGGIHGATVPDSATRPVPSPLVLEDLSGDQRSLDEFRGRVVIVNFWATWCPPCLREFPALERFKQDLEGRPFEVLAVNSGESRALVERFHRLLKTGLIVLLDSGRVETGAWGVDYFPTTFIIDPQGRIIHRLPGEIDWDNGENRRMAEDLLPDLPMAETVENRGTE